MKIVSLNAVTTAPASASSLRERPRSEPRPLGDLLDLALADLASVAVRSMAPQTVASSVAPDRGGQPHRHEGAAPAIRLRRAA